MGVDQEGIQDTALQPWIAKKNAALSQALYSIYSLGIWACSLAGFILQQSEGFLLKFNGDALESGGKSKVPEA